MWLTMITNKTTYFVFSVLWIAFQTIRRNR